MSLFHRNNTINSLKDASCGDSSTEAVPHEKYRLLEEENARLREALEAERCARADTDSRCRSLYEELTSEKEKCAQLQIKIQMLEASLAKAEAAEATLEKTLAEKNAALARLRKCFGKKSERLEQVLGANTFAQIRAALWPDVSDNAAGSEKTGGPETPKKRDPEDAAAAASGANGEENDANSQSSSGEGDTTGGGNSHNGQNTGRRVRRHMKRKAGFLNNYCSRAEDVVYTFDNINYTQEEISNFFGLEGSNASVYASSDIEIYRTLEYCPGFYYTMIHISPTIRKGDEAMRGLRTDRMLNASGVSPSVLSHAAFMKFRQGLPVNTFCELAREEGANISRETVTGWLNNSYEKLLLPVHMALLQYLKKHSVLISDETYAFLKECGKSGTGYFWGIRTSPLEDNCRQAVYYAFDKTRQSAVPLFYLHGFGGKLLTDGYAAYETFEAKNGGIIHCCCWVHGRRVLVEALPGGETLEEMTDEAKSKLWAWTSLCILTEMFRLEKEWNGLSAEKRLENRASKLAPLISRFYEEAHKAADSENFDASGAEGKAIQYFLKREDAMRRLLTDGAVPLSTNDIERCNIIVALTRKRAKMFGSARGAAAAAGYFSLICTALANGINPEKYLEYLFTVMPSVIHSHRTQIDDYMAYLEEAARRFETVKAKRSSNSSAPDEIDWEGLSEPDLSFLMEVMPWDESVQAFLKTGHQPDRKHILEEMTRKNIEESTLHPDVMRRILGTPKNLSDNRLDGLREILGNMAGQEGSHNDDVFQDSVVKGMAIYSSHYPQRFQEILAMRQQKNSAVCTPDHQYRAEDYNHTAPSDSSARGGSHAQDRASPGMSHWQSGTAPDCSLSLPGREAIFGFPGGSVP